MHLKFLHFVEGISNALDQDFLNILFLFNAVRIFSNMFSSAKILVNFTKSSLLFIMSFTKSINFASLKIIDFQPFF